MKSFLFVILSVVVISQASSRLLPLNDLIDDTCQETPFSDFCVSALRSDRHSSAAQGPAQLGIVLVDQIYSKAESTLTKIDTLISQTQDPLLKGALSYCRKSYYEMIHASVPSSRAALDQGFPEFAEHYMTDTAQAMGRCDYQFTDISSPLSSENDFVRRAASDVAAIAKTLE